MTLTIQKRINLKLVEVILGMAIHDQVRTLAKQRGSLEHLNNWKRRRVRERDLMDAIF